MKIIVVTLLCAIAMASTASARLGATEAEITQSYGQPTKTETSKVSGQSAKVYQSGGYTIGVTYIDGKSACEIIEKPNKAKFNNHELSALMKAAAPGQVWKLNKDSIYVGQEWKLPDGSSAVYVEGFKPRLTFTSKAEAEFIAKWRADHPGTMK